MSTLTQDQIKDWNIIRLGILQAWKRSAEPVVVVSYSTDTVERTETGPMLGVDAYGFAVGVVNDGGVLYAVRRGYHPTRPYGDELRSAVRSAVNRDRDLWLDPEDLESITDDVMNALRDHGVEPPF